MSGLPTGRVLGAEFFDRPTPKVARDLLGKVLVRATAAGVEALPITETEAYDGPRDKASHAHRGPTPRNAPMFAGAGTIYVYFTYGMHWMLNLVCGPEGYPAAVLIRGAGAVRGPARLTKALSIDRALDGKPLGVATGLWVEDRGIAVRPRDVQRTARIGIGYAEEWIDRPWRFVLAPAGATKARAVSARR